MKRPVQILIAVCALLGATAIAMALDPHGFRAWRRLSRDVCVADADNAALRLQIDVLSRKVEALRVGPKALERPAHENGYVHDNEVLYELK